MFIVEHHGEEMIINRVWAMPNKWTFQIKPIKELLNRYVNDGIGWIDPFAGENSPAEITNDLNPIAPAKYHLEAIEFIKSLNGNKYKGILFDPPYSLRQVKECYNKIGKHLSFGDTLDASFGKVKDAVSSKVDLAICCGWNTNGFGKNRGFELIEILLVPHGGHHNDTIVTVERKTAIREKGGL